MREIPCLAEEAAYISVCLQLDAQLNHSAERSDRTRYKGKPGSCQVRTDPRRSVPLARQRIDTPKQFRRLLPDWRKAACSARQTRPTYLPTEHSTVTSNFTTSAISLTLSNLLSLRTRKFTARFSVKGSRYAFETLELKTTFNNVRFHYFTAVVVKIRIFRFMTASTAVTGVLAVCIQDVEDE